MEKEIVLSLKNIYKKFGKKQVLSDFSYDFPKTGIISIMGASGCGKTTLLRIISRLEKPSKGLVEKDENITVSYVFQEPRLFPQFTAIENVECSGKKELAEKYLAKVMLSEYKDYLPSELSGGMQQRVALARALSAEADILLMDEAFRSQDEKTAEKLYELIKEYSKKHLVICVTHDSNEARKLSDDILFL